MMMDHQIDNIICLRPFYSLKVFLKGDVYVCCPAWPRGKVGNLKKKTLIGIWNDKPIQYMRMMMLEGRWEKICRPSCPVIINYRINKEIIYLDNLKPHAITQEIISEIKSKKIKLVTKPTCLELDNSMVCNINCIMCGREYFKNNTTLDNRALVGKAMEEVKELLPHLREVLLAGYGDPFARPDTREFLLNLDPSLYPELKINLLTNGLLLQKYWDKIKNLNFGYIDISVDAATKETYEKIRRGGKWKDLLNAFDIIKDNRELFLDARINMTVMRDNYREIPLFVELASKYGFGAYISRIRGKYGSQNIFTSSDKKLFEDLRNIIKEAIDKSRSLNVSFTEYVQPFIEMPWHQRYYQKGYDNLVYTCYRTKSLFKKGE